MRSAKISVSNCYLVVLLTVQAVVISLLFFVIKGNFGRTLSPVQPDSLLYICKGLSGGNLEPHQVSEILKNLNLYFQISTRSELQCGPTPGSFSGRLVLSFLIGIFAITGAWWAVLIPTILISNLCVYIWWLLTKEWVASRGKPGILLGILPWASPHIGFYVSLVLTEGPLILAVLLLLLQIRKAQTNSWYWLAVPITIAFGLMVRQSWPIFAIILATALTTLVKSIFQKTVVFSLGFIATASISTLTPQLSETQIDFLNFRSGISGLLLGIRHDFLHIFEFIDLPAVALLYLLIFNGRRKLSSVQKITAIGLMSFSSFTCYAVYLGDGSYGQNWRYFAPTFLVLVAFFMAPSSSDTKKLRVN
jgi:hypothetical protein